ncbi:hypothetical protein GCM10023196_040140 [Actinoallomurus vinaceus]|uniref:Uncharacterized protein n=1 Tax=Actinoallomurus vinaceus TaxID=1080074 RepID=A0ABP8UBK8_9ACTN
MGFDLNCYLTIDARVLPLYDRVIPGGAAYAIPARGRGLPAGWVLPVPWRLEYALDNAVTMVEDVIETGAVDEWRATAGVPRTPDPLDAFDDLDLQLTSLLSLASASGVMVINDRTFGGLRINEYAAVCVAGRLRAAYGIDYGDADRSPGRAFELRDGAYRPVDSAQVDPVAQCAAVLDPRFTGAFLFDGYLPREAEPTAPRRRPYEAGGSPAIRRDLAHEWAAYFPVLARLLASPCS